MFSLSSTLARRGNNFCKRRATTSSTARPWPSLSIAARASTCIEAERESLLLACAALAARASVPGRGPCQTICRTGGVGVWLRHPGARTNLFPLDRRIAFRRKGEFWFREAVALGAHLSSRRGPRVIGPLGEVGSKRAIIDVCIQAAPCRCFCRGLS